MNERSSSAHRRPHGSLNRGPRRAWTRSLAWAPFPEADPALLVDDTIEIPEQVNGKVRARITVAAGLSQDDLQAAAHADPQVTDLLAGQTVRKVIAVKDKLVNFVVA